MDRRDRALAYYEALDDGDYDRLAALLAAEFVHDRPDLTLEGRERFVRFVREERPRTDTAHAVDGVYGPTIAGDGGANDRGEVVVRGRLLAGVGAERDDPTEVKPDGCVDAERDDPTEAGRDGGGEVLVDFVDVFSFEGGRVARIDTYTR